MTKEELLKAFIEKMLGMPRVVESIVRINPNSEGIISRESHVEGIHQGAYRSLDIKEEGMLSCGHVGQIRASCGFPDENLPSPHFACPSCSAVCRGCHLAMCLRHVEIVEGMTLCLSCARNAKLDALGQKLLGAFWRCLE